MTISIGSPIDPTQDARLPMSGRTIPLAERMRTAEVPADETPDSEEELDPVKIIFNMVFADFMEQLANGDEEETGNVTLEVDY
jgi:hypothetical protein